MDRRKSEGAGDSWGEILKPTPLTTAVFEESEGPGVEVSQVLLKTCWGLSR